MSDLIRRDDAIDAVHYYIESGYKCDIFQELKDLPSAEPERTAKVEEAVPNMTILKRKVDLLSILQAIKTDKIRVWLNYDGKICFQNTKTGNEISVEPYYDMEGNTNNE